MSTARITEKLPEEKRLDVLLDEIKVEFNVEFIRDEAKAIDALIKRKTLKHYSQNAPAEKIEPVQQVKRAGK